MSTAEDKAILLLKSLPQDVAENVLAQLGPERGVLLRARLQRLEQPAPQAGDLDQVLQEFTKLLRGPPHDPYEPAPSSARSDPRAATPPPPVPKAHTHESPQPDLLDDPLAALRRLPVEQLAAALQGESLPTVTVVLSCLETTPAGEALKRLPPDTRRDVLVRLGRPLAVAPALVQTVARAGRRKCQLSGDQPRETSADDRFRKMADVFRMLERADRMEALTALEQNDAETAAKVKDLLYRFEDLLQIEDRSMQKLLGEFDAKSLAT